MSQERPNLTLGHSLSRTDVVIAGLEVQVWGLDEIKSGSKPIAVVLANHGRQNSVKQMQPFANGLLGHLAELRPAGDRRRDVIVVTLDSRNHGTRLKHKVGNMGYEDNPRHLYDMAATIAGTCRDNSLLIDFLAAYLFPHGERVVDEWIATGFSLGGHVTWRLLQEEPRITTAIPIMGLPLPSFIPLLKARAEGLAIPFEPPLYPPSLRAFFESPAPPGTFRGKNILTIHGLEDKTVPYVMGKDEIARIVDEVKEGGGGDMDVWLVEKTGHELKPEMVTRTAEWIDKHALRTSSKL